MKYPRSITSVHQLEISSQCNLRCKYCPHPHLEREKDYMDFLTFEKSLEIIKEFERQGTQNELALTGMGEAIMHPDFAIMAGICRQSVSGKITMSTNGVAFTYEIAKICADHAIDVYVSAHRPEKAGPAIQLARECGVLKDVNGGAIVSAFDWGGQVDWFVSAPKVWCEYLRKGWCVILVDGSITTCCIDAHGKGVFSHVDTLLQNQPEKGLQPWDLCTSCHMTIPT